MGELARHFQHLPAYRRPLESLRQADDVAYRAPCGLFFGSLHGTLNHLAVNHGPHPRGQASAAISAPGLETPAMDFIYFKPEPA